jgi:hypothetical protein
MSRRSIKAQAAVEWTCLVLLTLVAIAASLFLMVDLYKGVVVASGRGIHGTYVVTSLERSAKGTVSSVGTFTAEDGSVTLDGTKLEWDKSDVGSSHPAQYVPTPLDGIAPIAVMSPGVGGVLTALGFLAVFLPIALIGSIGLPSYLAEAIRHRRRRKRSDDSVNPDTQASGLFSGEQSPTNPS